MNNFLMLVLLSLSVLQSANKTGVTGSPLGITTTPLDGATLAGLKAKYQNGIVITDIDPNSIAAEIGLKKGDIIHSINGQDIIMDQQLSTIINGMKEGGRMEITITRDHKIWSLKGAVHKRS